MSIFYENPALKNFWYSVATELEIASKPIGRTVLGVNIVVYRDADGNVVAAPDRCPHREALLSKGSVNGGVLSCCYHGWEFGAEGKCTRIPSADPKFPIPDNANLPTIQSTTRYGLVWVCLGENPPPIITVVEDEDPEFRRINNPVETWTASATRMADNFMDIAHFPWVHRESFGDDQPTFVPDIEVKQLDQDFHGYEYEVRVGDRPDKSGDTVGEWFTRKMSTGFNLPFITRSTIAYPEGLDHILLLVNTPIDDLNTLFTFIVWRNDDFSVSAEELMLFDRSIGAEDRRMLESIPGVLPLSPRALANTQSDKPSTYWRQHFVKLLQSGETT